MTFSAQLLDKYSSLYQKSISHPLTTELCTGTLPDEVLLTYLVQDLKYFKVGMNFFGRALSLCDHFPSMVVLGKQIGFIAEDEHGYFERVIGELTSAAEGGASGPINTKYGTSGAIGTTDGSSGTTDGSREAELPQVTEYINYMEYLLKEGDYGELITGLYVMEQVYLGWAQRNEEIIPEGLEYKYKEWVELHRGEAFERWTEFLRREIDRVCPEERSDEGHGSGHGASSSASSSATGPSSSQRDRCAAVFKKMLELEIGFFDGCYYKHPDTS